MPNSPIGLLELLVAEGHARSPRPAASEHLAGLRSPVAAGKVVL